MLRRLSWLGGGGCGERVGELGFLKILKSQMNQNVTGHLR